MDDGVSITEELSSHFFLKQIVCDWQFANSPIATIVEANSECNCFHILTVI